MASETRRARPRFVKGEMRRETHLIIARFRHLAPALLSFSLSLYALSHTRFTHYRRFPSVLCARHRVPTLGGGPWYVELSAAPELYFTTCVASAPHFASDGSRDVTRGVDDESASLSLSLSLSSSLSIGAR